MLRIRINPSVDYYIKNDKSDELMTILDVYDNDVFHNGSPNKLYVKHDDKYIDYGDITKFELNYKSMFGKNHSKSKTRIDYTYNEIRALYSSGTFTLSKRQMLWENELIKQLNITGNVVLSIFVDSVITVYTLLEIYHLMIFKYPFIDKKYHLIRQLFIQNDDKIYNIQLTDLHINDRFILDYTFQELSDIQDSKNYTIGPNPLI
jgi:hypothetical protein